MALPSRFLAYAHTQYRPGLTEDHPTLTTFFEGEIIGSNQLKGEVSGIYFHSKSEK